MATLRQHLDRHLTDKGAADIARTIESVAAACIEISALIRTAPLAGLSGAIGTTNVQGEAQKPLDVASNEIFVRRLRENDAVGWGVSEEVDEPIPLASHGRLGVLFDPLDGSSNLDVNVTVGSIFSIIPCASAEQLLQPGSDQLAAGFAAYGPATSLVIAFAGRVSLFILADGEFILAQDDIRIPSGNREYAINSSREHLWDDGIRGYIAACNAGPQRYNMRWVGSMVAEVQRILNRGGVFLYPADAETRSKGGRLRLLYEANPMSYIMQAAGGAASTGTVKLLEVQPEQIHQRVPVILGDADEVRRIEEFVAAHGSA